MNSTISGLSIKYEKEQRFIFTAENALVNPRQERGKLGTRQHNAISKAFLPKSIFGMLIHNKETNREETVYLSKKSAIKWINAQVKEHEQLSSVVPNEQVIQKIQDICKDKIDWKEHVHLHKGHASQHALNRTVDKIKGLFWNKFWKFTVSSWTRFRARFQVMRNESSLFKASQERANAIFWKAVSEVPAYQAHLNGFHPQQFGQIPLTDKDSYIKKHSIEDTLLNGEVPYKGQSDTSTGSSGKPTTWIRGPKELKTVRTLINYATKVVKGDKPLFFINAFALGPWATGMTTAGAMVDRAIVHSVGPNADKILDFLEEFPKEKYPDHHYVIAGYPPFMRDLILKAKERNINLTKYDISAVVGGEACPDTLREMLLGGQEKTDQCFSQVFSSYGASDLDINIGYESPFELALRKACHENPAFAAEFYGPNEPVPMIFHYDPLNYYIETNDQQQLIFTCVRDDRVSPRIRYNLKDRGKVIPVSEVQALMKKYGIQLPIQPNTQLPLLLIWGREGTVNYRGAKVPAEHLYDAIEQVKIDLVDIINTGKTEEKEILKGKVKNYAFNAVTDGNPSVEIWIEMDDKQAVPEDIESIRIKLLEELRKINKDFDFQMQNADKEHWPSLKIFASGKAGPMSNQDPHRKKKYVFTDGK